MSEIELVHWNPLAQIKREGWMRWARKDRVNNFGDLLGPTVVRHLLGRAGVPAETGACPRRLLSVGSIMHFARDGDVVWGTGVNGKTETREYDFTHLDVRAVRGPLTRTFLMDRGIPVPEVYGDPALLLPDLDPRLAEWGRTKRFDVTVVPNLNDYRSMAKSSDLMNPCAPLDDCLRRIAESHFVVSSSLHGIVIAEALGIDARLLRSGSEHAFKYADYYLGTGRPEHVVAGSVKEALRLGSEKKMEWNPEPLLAVFPFDLWAARDRGRGRDS